MEHGWSLPITGMSGCPMWIPDSLPMPPMVTGYTLIWVGPGFRTINGDGRHFTMAAGITIPITVPCGFPETNGGRDGLRGEDPEGITDGRQADPVAASAWHTA